LLDQTTIPQLQNKKNLLAFSAGGDSTALFFLLLDAKIDFDIAIVDYGIREQSKTEVAYAQELAIKHDKKCYTFDASGIQKNFEANARAMRYQFFENTINRFGYENLLTAHHIGDRFEWMLMQFCKGAGCVEIAGMQKIEKRENYKLIRPLLDLEKNDLLSYLDAKDIKYFEDETNFDESYKRNSFRHNFSNPLLEKYKDGIKKSFNYIDEDRDLLLEDIEIIKIDDMAYFKSSDNRRADIYTIDKYIKSCGHLTSASERELLNTKDSIVLGRKFLVSKNGDYIFITTYINENKTMDKKFKDKMRRLKIEPKLRSYLYMNQNAKEVVLKLFS
jgi:tRNA(Ile)-lysidine synthase